MTKFIQVFIYTLIILTPLFGLGEGLGVVGFNISATLLLYLKGLRDLMIAFLFVILLINFIVYRKPSANFLFTFSILSIFTVLCILFSSNFIIILVGIRWVLPFFIFLLLIKIIDYRFLKKLSHILFYLVLTNLIMQVYQIFNMPPIRGSLPGGLSGRVAGFFALPSISGTLAVFVYFLLNYFSEYKRKKKRLALIICSLSVIVSMSSTGIGLLFILFLFPYYLKSKYQIFLIILIAPSIVLGIYNLDNLTGRYEGASYTSFSKRQEILVDQLENVELISTKFGIATNGAVSLRRNLDIKNAAFIADSLYTSILGNYGLLFATLLFSGFFIIGIIVFLKKNYQLQLFYLLLLLSFATLIITEIYPLNILIPCVCSFYIWRSNSEKNKIIN